MRIPRWLPVLCLFAAAGSGCVAPQPPSQRVTDAARETNMAARFGRMDLAVEHAAEGTRAQFAKRHADWGGAIRVFDLELSGLNMPDTEHATVFVDVQWMRIDENMLRTTRLEQSWRGTGKDGGWVLARERRVSGDIGLFGEPVARNDADTPHGDVQFPTKTIRSIE
jgi:hypothetical protein